MMRDKHYFECSICGTGYETEEKARACNESCIKNRKYLKH